MKVFSIIKDEDVIKETPEYLGFWKLKTNAPPNTKGKIQEYHFDDSTS